MPQILWIRQAFGRPLSRQFQSEWQARRNYLGISSLAGKYRVILKVAGKGDLNTVDVGAAVREGILRRVGIFRFDNQLRYGLPSSSSRELVGVYIDDLLVLLEVRRADASKPDLDSQLSASASAAYVSPRIPEALHKAYDQKLCFKAWRAEVECGVGSVGAPGIQARPLACGLGDAGLG